MNVVYLKKSISFIINQKSEIFFTLHATELKEFCLTFQRFFQQLKIIKI